ncbi:hypothetical protein HXX76_009472 [Chlamydomonas incerta]|uniref:Nucleotide-diphospho-sugar transferase domain-containing protein n=1 Tax=Chlamydomonas incerta TaxID=51695 RepID=A0A835VW09_CHLIN|nr:hypothetical protein HXX76_009472 [Chlamydomonas incerta]|eukprot:KAG2431457.1 hypothetical protein HXX76_009472 [Chlamydomonas incerta]
MWADDRVTDGSQGLFRLREAGYAHVLGVLEEPVQCERLRYVFLPWLAEEGPVSCGTYATKDPATGKEYPFRFNYFRKGLGMPAWWKKFFTAGRAVALGYNVLAVDLDVLIMDDWYFRVKQPPLSNYHMLSQNEWGINLNCGFMYFQNASPTGPVAWILFDYMNRVVRWAEDDTWLAETSPYYSKHRGMPVTEQGMLQDCVFSCVNGRPTYAAILNIFRDDKEAYAKLNTTEHELFRALHDPLHKVWEQRKMYNVTGELASAVCEQYKETNCTAPMAQVAISSVELKMPHSGGQYPLQLGGYPFNRTLGPYALAYKAAFQELGVPLPPDPEDPATEAAARATKPELFGYLAVRDGGDSHCLGCWAQSTWMMAGKHGWWHRHLVPQQQRGKMGLGHMWAALPPGDFQKHLIYMWTGHWNRRIAARASEGRQRMFLTNQPVSGPGGRVEVPEWRAVVAYAPGVIHSGLGKEQFLAASAGLAQVATALRAIAAWPTVPCDSDWALLPEVRGKIQKPIKHSIPWSTYLDTTFQVVPFGETLDTLQCDWPGFTHVDCMVNRQPPGQEVGRGMMGVEFAALRAAQGARGAPSPQTTIDLGMGPAPAAGGVQLVDVPYAALKSLNSESVLDRLTRESVAVFWLDRLVGSVTNMTGQAGEVYKRWHTKCQALHYYTLPAAHRERW